MLYHCMRAESKMLLQHWELLSRYNRVIVAELNDGQFARYPQAEIPQLNIHRINKVQGQPFLVHEIVDEVNKIMEG